MLRLPKQITIAGGPSVADIYFVTALEVGKSKIKVLSWRVHFLASMLDFQATTMCSHGLSFVLEVRDRKLSGVSSFFFLFKIFKIYF